MLESLETQKLRSLKTIASSSITRAWIMMNLLLPCGYNHCDLRI